VLFDKIASVYFTGKIYLYFSTGNGQPRKPALCQLYRHTFVLYTRKNGWIDRCAVCGKDCKVDLLNARSQHMNWTELNSSSQTPALFADFRCDHSYCNTPARKRSSARLSSFAANNPLGIRFVWKLNGKGHGEVAISHENDTLSCKPHEIIQQNRPLIGNDTDPTLAVTFSVTLSERLTATLLSRYFNC